MVAIQLGAGRVCRVPGLRAQTSARWSEEALFELLGDAGLVPVEGEGVGGAAEGGGDAVALARGGDGGQPVQCLKEQAVLSVAADEAQLLSECFFCLGRLAGEERRKRCVAVC